MAQHHRIHAAAHRQQNTIAGDEQLIFGDKRLKSGDEILHFLTTEFTQNTQYPVN